MKSYTDIGQSKRLAEILPAESADMYWAERYAGKVMLNGQYIVDKEPLYYPCLVKPSKGNYSQDIVRDIPCWSLSALLDVLPLEVSINKQTDGVDTYYYIATCDAHYCDVYSHRHINVVDACYEMIVKLHELKLL